MASSLRSKDMIHSEQKGGGKVMHYAFNMEIASPLR